MLNFAICDDCLCDLHRVSNMLEKIFMKDNLDAQISISTLDANKLLNFVDENHIDVLILGIKLHSNLTGLDVARIIRNKNKDCYIIFTTAHIEFVFSAYKYKTFDYLCKPLAEEALEETILRLFEDIKSYSSNRKYICLGNNNTLINGDSIQYIKRDGMKLSFCTDSKTYSVYSSFNKIQPQLPKNFVRCHKSFIVNTDKITKLDSKSNLVYLKNNETCDIGPKYKKDFLKEVTFYE